MKKAVKNSLLDLLKVVGDDKNTPVSIFRLSVEIENSQLVYKPPCEYLITMLRGCMSNMTEIFKDFKRMEVLMTDERKKKLEEIRILKEKETKNNP